jgi:nicotinamide mononucleotide transporter
MTHPAVEVTANVFNAMSIVLAGLNSVHTWWVGIVGSLLFAGVFYSAQLYADVTLQVFFIVTSIIGWLGWARGSNGAPLPVRRTGLLPLAGMLVAGTLVAAGYGWLLSRFTDAFAPFVDSAVLAFSVVGQFLLMRRRYESWWFWLLVNTISVPLYAARGLAVTAVLSAAYWVNAVFALIRWRRELEEAGEQARVSRASC